MAARPVAADSPRACPRETAVSHAPPAPRAPNPARSTEKSAMQRIRLAWIGSCAIVVATSASAADLEARSTIDSVIVYPDGAAVTRIIRADLPGGDSVLLARDFPPGLDPA